MNEILQYAIFLIENFAANEFLTRLSFVIHN